MSSEEGILNNIINIHVSERGVTGWKEYFLFKIFFIHNKSESHYIEMEYYIVVVSKNNWNFYISFAIKFFFIFFCVRGKMKNLDEKLKKLSQVL